MSFTYADPPLRMKASQEQPSAVLFTCVLLAVSVVACLQSVYYDVRAQNNYAASAALHGTLSLLEQQRREEIADFDSLNGKLTELLSTIDKEKVDASIGVR